MGKGGYWKSMVLSWQKHLQIVLEVYEEKQLKELPSSNLIPEAYSPRKTHQEAEYTVPCSTEFSLLDILEHRLHNPFFKQEMRVRWGQSSGQTMTLFLSFELEVWGRMSMRGEHGLIGHLGQWRGNRLVLQCHFWVGVWRDKANCLLVGATIKDWKFYRIKEILL